MTVWSLLPRSYYYRKDRVVTRTQLLDTWPKYYEKFGQAMLGDYKTRLPLVENDGLFKKWNGDQLYAGQIDSVNRTSIRESTH